MLIERLRRALAPKYEVFDEVARGGMGIVYSGRHVPLDLPVAIKLLQPELATATLAERFIQEPRIQARLSHPSIVPVYDAGEADGLFYYVMEFIEGETLATRLKRGPLAPAEARSLALGLLGALGLAHAQGVIHRDVKPANIFLRNGQVLLCDFGIARSRTNPGLTATGESAGGTPMYMPPEQWAGQATERTDVYAAGMVLWEACTGEAWTLNDSPEKVDWSRLPEFMIGPVRRALAWAPEYRFASAVEMGAALQPEGPLATMAKAGAAVRPEAARARRWRYLVLVGLVVVAGVYALRERPRAPAPTPGLTLEVESFEDRGVPGGEQLRDSLTTSLITALQGYPDLRVLSAGSGPSVPGAVRLSGVMTPAAGGIRLELRATGGDAGVVTIAGEASSARAGWPALVRQVADSFLAAVWRGSLAGDKWLPLAALPRTGEGLGQWHKAERLYAEGHWDEARDAYARLETSDTTCVLCTYRLIDINRWLGDDDDSTRFVRLNRHLDAFPPHYRAIILAQQRPWPERYDSLRAAADRYQPFFLASFLLGDELFHRGPLYRHLRHEALEPLQRAVTLRPDFAPGWEHLGWVLLSEGSAADAKTAIDSVPPERGAAGLSIALRMMLKVGYLWRFGTATEAAAFTSVILQNPDVLKDPRTTSGGRMMMTLDTPTGAVGVGAQLAAWRDKPEAVRAGLLAQAHGFAALGRIDSLRAVGLRLRQSDADHEPALYALELQALLTLADPEDSTPADPRLLSTLQAYTPPGMEAEPLRERAAWMLAMLALRAGDSTAAAKYRETIPAGLPQNSLRTEVDVYGLLHRGDNAGARKLLEGLHPSDLSHVQPIAVEDAVLRLLHVTWLVQTGASGLAEKELRWHEHLQLDGFATGMPQPGEPAWALSTLLRWRRARMLDHGDSPDLELCATYRQVARLWSGADPRLAGRAVIADRRAAELKCEPAA